MKKSLENTKTSGKSQSFDEYWKEEEEWMKLSYNVSKQWKKERHNKSPAKELVQRIENREKKYGNNRRKNEES